MAEGLLEDRKATNGPSAVPAAGVPSPGEALFQRRIEFRPATKSFSGTGTASGFYLETLNPSTDGQAPNASSGDADEAARAGVGKQSNKVEAKKDLSVVDPELSYKITFRRIGAGLENMGNTCFLNSVLQCLTYTEPFAAYLQSGKHKSSCRTSGFCAMCALQNHVMIALQSTGKILYPSQLVKNLRSISRNFRYARQEDAHEYMVNLLESMHKCCLPSGVPSESPSAYEKSLVHKIFGGRLRSQVKCLQCSYLSNKYDPFLDLSLDIVKADSISKALGHFTAFEQLDGGERQYQCQRCKQKVRAAKRLTVHKAPYVLTIHLKRFGSVLGQKIDKRVEFEPTLNLKPFVSDPQEGDAIYTLYGVLVHAGYTTRSGHYYCYVRTSSGLWYSLNDNQVMQVSEKVVLAQKAYMLFYTRNRSYAPKQTVDIVRKENIFAAASGVGLLVSSKFPKEMMQNVVEKVSGTNILLSSKINAKESMQKLTFDFPSLNVKGEQSAQNASHCSLNDGVKDQSQKLTEKDMMVQNHVKRCPSNGLLSVVDALHPAHEGHVSSSSSQHSSRCHMVSEDLLLPASNIKCSIPPAEEFIPPTIAKEKLNEKPPVLRQDSKVNGFGGTNLEDIGKKVTVLEGKSISDPTGDNAGQLKKVLSGSSRLCSTDKCLQKEILPVDRKHQSPDMERGFKSVKGPKFTHARLLHGPRHLLLASLSLRKRNKLKKSKKKHLNGKFICSVLSEQETSTSNTVKVVAVNGETPAKRHSQPGSPKELNRDQSEQNEVHKMTDLNLRNSVSKKLYANGPSPELRNTDAVMVQDVARQHQICSDLNSRNGRHIDVNDSHLSNGRAMRVLMNSLSGAYVPKWDEVDQPQANGQLVGQDRSIGHVLDEWDEDYDRGKRKKVRRSQFYSNESNPFEEIAKQNAQQKMKKKTKLDKIKSGNQPFRIF